MSRIAANDFVFFLGESGEDIDWHSGKNNTPRHSKDEKWWVVPLFLSGPYIAGSHALPANLANYYPWEFKWPEKTKEITRMRKKYKENPQPNILAILRSLTDEIGVEEVETAKINDEEANAAKIKGKNKAISRKDKSSGPSSKRRKVQSPSHSNSQVSEDSENENEIDISSAKGTHSDTSAMSLLSGIFSDPMQGLGDDNLSATCEALAKICDAPLLEDTESFRGISRTMTPSLLNALNALSGRASFVVASDLEKRRNNLEKKNLQLNKKVRELEIEVASSRDKDERIQKLETELDSQKTKVSTLRSANQQLYESEKRFQTRIGELEIEKERLAKDLSLRENRYSKLKQQFQTTVANFNNDAVRFRNQAMEIVCNDHNIPLHSYPFLAEEVPENLPVSDVSDSEANEEEESGDESDGTKESDQEEEPAKK